MVLLVVSVNATSGTVRPKLCGRKTLNDPPGARVCSHLLRKIHPSIRLCTSAVYTVGTFMCRDATKLDGGSGAPRPLPTRIEHF